MNDVVVIGAGNVGREVLNDLKLRDANLNLKLIDRNKELAKSVAEDINHVNVFKNKIEVIDFINIKKDSLVVLAIGVKEQENRRLYLYKSYKMVNEIMKCLRDIEFNGYILVLSNPNDLITTYFSREYDSKKVFGSGTFLDTNRLRMKIYNDYKIKSDSYVYGEHGMNQEIFWKNDCNFISNADKLKIAEYTKTIAYQIIKNKGYTNSGISYAACQIIENFFNDSKSELVLSTYDENYGIAHSRLCKFKKHCIIYDKNYKSISMSSINHIKNEDKMFNGSLRIGIDLDDTLTNLSSYMEEEAIKFDKSINGRGIVNHDCYLVGEKYNWSKENLELFFKYYRKNAVEKAKLKNKTVENLNAILKNNAEVFIITARSNKYYENAYQYTYKWLKDHHVPFSKLITNVKDKKKICLDEQIDIFIDDMLENCLSVSEIVNIKVCMMKNKNNYKFMVKNSNICLIKSLNEIKELL